MCWARRLALAAWVTSVDGTADAILTPPSLPLWAAALATFPEPGWVCAGEMAPLAQRGQPVPDRRFPALEVPIVHHRPCVQWWKFHVVVSRVPVGLPAFSSIVDDVLSVRLSVP